MPTETPGTSAAVIAGLKAAAEHLRAEDRVQAEQTLVEIGDQIRFLSEAASEKRETATIEQQRQTELLASTLVSETNVHNQLCEVQADIARALAEIASGQANEAALQSHIQTLQASLDASRQARAAHEARLRERERYLNDTSFLSILRSIGSLGFDRLGVAIQALIENDSLMIANLQDELSRTLSAYRGDVDEAARQAQLLSSLQAQEKQYEAFMADYRSKESSLHELESAYRAKVVALTDVALFYGKVALLVNDVAHRVQDVVDIVAELNDTTPRILDFDESGEVLVSLRDSLSRFDRMLNESTPRTLQLTTH